MKDIEYWKKRVKKYIPVDEQNELLEQLNDLRTIQFKKNKSSSSGNSTISSVESSGSNETITNVKS